MQVVYISARPTIFAGTLQSVTEYMKFIGQVVVVVPEELREEFQEIADSLSITLPIHILSDEAVTGLSTHAIQSMDHQIRNYTIRSKLANLDEVESEFLMSDDDYRPLRPIEIEAFKEKGKYHSYYFYELEQWVHGTNSFDIGQRYTCQVLKHHGFDQYAFASHMPQIFNKELFRSSIQFFAPYTSELELCEWSTYFNYAHNSHPDLFHEPQIYQTLCWPDCISCWPRMFEQPTFLFENFSPSLYSTSGPFHQLDKHYSNKIPTSLKKTLAWAEYESSIVRGENLENRSLIKRALLRSLSPIRRMMELLSIRERNLLYRRNDSMMSTKQIDSRISFHDEN